MEERKIFISYSWNDHDNAKDIITKLKTEQYSVLSLDQIDASSDPVAPIIECMMKSDTVIVLFSENYSRSSYGLREMTFAISKHKQVIIVAIGDVLLPAYIESFVYAKVGSFDEASNVIICALSELYDKKDVLPDSKPRINGRHDNLEEVIATLKKALADNKLSLVCGAGVSIPSGIPTWNELLRSMIDNEVFDGKKSHDPNDGSAEELISFMSQSSIILGKYLKIISGTNFERNVKKALYKNIDMSNENSGEYANTKLMDAIAELARPKRRGRHVESVITFNFDDIIETKLEKMRIDFCSIWKEGQSHDVDELPIYHVHGFLPHHKDIDNPNLVFSEEAYHSQFIDPYSWSNILQLNTFSSNVCLFVGLSLSDPNLRRLLDISWRRNQCKKHYIVMKKAIVQVGRNADRDDDENIADVANMLFEQDANNLGLNVIWCSNYDEVPDILKKIGG